VSAPARLSSALVLSLVLWLPSLSACLRGAIELEVAILRYGLAFVLARVGIGILSALMHSYRPEEDDEEEAELFDDPGDVLARRAEDLEAGDTVTGLEVT
jgi:hypothetical protein